MQIKEQVYELYILTPLKSHRNKNKLEFRYPQLKAGMRFWWRAVKEFESAECMHIKEDEMFGSTAKKSPVRFIPIKDIRKKKNNSVDDSFIKFRMCCNEEIDNWETYQALLELSLCLGGVGQNSRKGYGALYLKKEMPLANSEEQVIGKIKDLLCRISNKKVEVKENKKEKTIYLNQNGSNCIDKMSYPTVSKIFIGKKCSKQVFLENAEIVANKVKKIYRKKILSPIVWNSCYPGGKNEVYPIICQFNSKNDCAISNVIVEIFL